VKATGDLTAHAEIEAVRRACVVLQAIRLDGCTLYTTAEPCFMCSYAIRQARISQVVIGRPTPEVGGVSSRHAILTDPAIAVWSSPPTICAVVLRHECEELLNRK
jgi:tRNA(adenine34) deaminase